MIECEGAINHVMSRGDRREAILGRKLVALGSLNPSLPSFGIVLYAQDL